MIITLIIFLCVPADVEGKEICYDPLDCFSDMTPWSGTTQRLKIPLPWSPEKINTRFLLLTRDNLNKHQEIDVKSARSTAAVTSLFQTSRRTCFIVHGMSDTAEDNWVPRLCRDQRTRREAAIEEILQVEDINCIGVDWHQGSGNVLMYSQAASNVRVVGAQIAQLLRSWQEEMSYSPTNVHIIGHSLGAQVAGEAGKRHRGIRRITGLDPARLHFEGTPNEVSLDASDADFVDIIHSDIDPLFGLGLINPAGHFDFYPNGGRNMPGCPDRFSFLTDVKAIAETIGCNHLQALHYYIESVRHPRGFVSYPCPNYQMYQDGSCFPCPPRGCPDMGYFSELWSPGLTPGGETFYLHTRSVPGRLSCYRYKVTVTVTILGGCKVSGQIYITLYGDETASEQHQLMAGKFTPGNSYSEFMDSDVILDVINCVDFLWTPPPLQPNTWPSQMGAVRIDFQSGEDGRMFSFCAMGTVKDKVAQTLGPCRKIQDQSWGHRPEYQDNLL